MKDISKISLSVAFASVYAVAEYLSHNYESGLTKTAAETIAKLAFYTPLVWWIITAQDLARSLRDLGLRIDESLKTLGSKVETNLIGLGLKADRFEAFLGTTKEQMLNDERIIFARSELSRKDPITVVGIEQVNPVPLPLSDAPRSGGAEWVRSLSLLRYDRIQDLLFSREYLQHFFTLQHRANKKSRILVVKDHPRSTDAYRSFLQISEECKIDTYVYRKSEFYKMLEIVSSLCRNEDADALREILEGNLELNLMVENIEFKEYPGENAVEKDMDFVLRFLSKTGQIVTRTADSLDSIPHRRVALTLELLSVAMNNGRKGVKAFEAIQGISAIPENFWSEKYLRGLKWNG